MCYWFSYFSAFVKRRHCEKLNLPPEALFSIFKDLHLSNVTHNFIKMLSHYFMINLFFLYDNLLKGCEVTKRLEATCSDSQLWCLLCLVHLTLRCETEVFLCQQFSVQVSCKIRVLYKLHSEKCCFTWLLSQGQHTNTGGWWSG